MVGKMTTFSSIVWGKFLIKDVIIKVPFNDIV
jgi:hypothetical protein